MGTSWVKSVASDLSWALFNRRHRLKRRYLHRLVVGLPSTDPQYACFVEGRSDLAIANNNSRMAIAVSASPHDGRVLVLKAGTDVPSRQELDAETLCLERLRRDLAHSDWLRYLPQRVVARPDTARPFVVDESSSPHTALEVAREVGLDESVVADAFDVIDALRRETARAVVAEGPFIEQTVLRRVELVRRRWVRDLLWKDDRAHWDHLTRELTASLLGRRVEAGWQHGDFSLGNILVDRTRSVVTGVIDWGAGEPHDLVGVDPSLLALSVHGFRTATEVNDVVARLVATLAHPGGESEEERRLVERLRFAWPETQDLSLMQGVIVTWIYHVAHLFKIRSPNVLAPGHWVQRGASRTLTAIVEHGVPALHPRSAG